MLSVRKAELNVLAAEVVRRHTAPAPLPRRWDVLARWRRRRYRSQLVGVPLHELRAAVAKYSGRT